MEKNIEPFSLKEDGVLRYQDCLCVSDIEGLKEFILEEAHGSKYSIHPGSTKMYHGLKEHFWWNGMKQDIATYMSRCHTCQQVKAEHQRPGGLSQDIDIPMEVGGHKHGFCNGFTQG